MAHERHMINPQIIGVPNAEQQARIDAGEFLTNIWQGEMQQEPVNMRGNPVGFADGLALGLPGVRRFRMAFNTYSFNPDGSFRPDMEAFLSRMWENGYEALWVLMDGPSQETGDANTLHTQWPNSYQVMSGLQDWLDLMPRLAARHAEAWGKLLAWLVAHPEARTGGFEAINEPASYARAAGRFPASAATFVHAYVDHVEAIYHQISAAWPAADFFVGGWNYSATFDVLRDTDMPGGGISALNYLRALIGARLVWSIHLYPQWGPNAQTLDSLNTWMDNRFRPILSDRKVFTEFNLQNGQANNWKLPSDDARSTFMFSRAGEWFVRREAGIGWWPVVNYAAGYLFYISGTGRLRQRQQNSYGGGLGLFAMGNHPDMFSGRPVSGYSPLTIVPLDEPPVVTANDWRNGAEIPEAASFAYGFGGAGVCVLNGNYDSNNFLIGGNGRTIMRGGNRDDQLVTGLGGGVVRTGRGNNVVTVNGGASRVYCGDGYNLVSLLRGATELVLDPAGNHMVFGFSPGKGDRISFMGAFSDLIALRMASITQSAGTNIASEVNLIVNLPGGGQVTFHNGAPLADILHRSCLDMTAGWYATGWAEPVDYTESQFNDPIVDPTDPVTSGYRPRTRDGASVTVRDKAGAEVVIKVPGLIT